MHAPLDAGESVEVVDDSAVAPARRARLSCGARRILPRNLCRACRRGACKVLYCSPRCRRWGQDRLRKIRRRQEALTAWRQELRQPDTPYAPEEMQRQIDELAAELFILEHATRRAPADEQADGERHRARVSELI